MRRGGQAARLHRTEGAKKGGAIHRSCKLTFWAARFCLAHPAGGPPALPALPLFLASQVSVVTLKSRQSPELQVEIANGPGVEMGGAGGLQFTRRVPVCFPVHPVMLRRIF